MSKKVIKVILIILAILAVLGLSLWITISLVLGLFRNKIGTINNEANNTTQNEPSNQIVPSTSNIILSEAFASASLRYYYPSSKNPSLNTNCPLSYTFDVKTNWTTIKPISSAKMENITVKTDLKNYNTFVFPLKHLKYDDFPSGIGINEMYPDGMLMYRDQLSQITSVGTGYTIPLSTKYVPEYQDEITSTYGYTSFGIKLVDFAHLNYNDIIRGNSAQSTSSMLLAASGLTKSDLNATIDYDLVLTFTDSTTETKHINIVIDGNQMGDYSLPKQDYTK